MRACREPYSVLIVSSAEKASTYLSEHLKPQQYSPVTVVKSGSEARRTISEAGFDLIIINAPLLDEFGHELAVFFTEQSVAGILLLVKNDVFQEAAYRVEEYGVLTLAKPLSRPLEDQSLHLIAATREKLRKLETKKEKLQVKIQEIRLIDRAKLALVEYLNMSEAQAHRYIEKQAMDMRKTKRAVAESILRTYESG